jgi:hypothetical protein
VLLSTAEAAGLITAPSFVSELTVRITAVAHSAKLTTSAVIVIWRATLQPLVPYAFVLVVVMSLACAALGAALNRVALGRTFQL